LWHYSSSNQPRRPEELAVTEFRVDARRQQRPRCARCDFDFEEGYSWHAFGEVIVLCSDCTSDIESSVSSYGETPDRANRRFLEKLREIVSPPSSRRRRLRV
jgi:hypothetical protein